MEAPFGTKARNRPLCRSFLRALPKMLWDEQRKLWFPIVPLGAEVGKLAAIVDCNGLKDTGRSFRSIHRAARSWRPITASLVLPGIRNAR